jgi:hypothetical protein
MPVPHTMFRIEFQDGAIFDPLIRLHPFERKSFENFFARLARVKFPLISFSGICVHLRKGPIWSVLVTVAVIYRAFPVK